MIGTGLGSAFYLYFTYKKCQISTIKDVLKLVIFADTIFTAPSVVVQLVTGLMLSNLLSLTYSDWFWRVIAVSVIVLVLWLRAAFIQYKLRGLLAGVDEIPPKFHNYMKQWFYLGVPSFLGSIYIYYLMVYRVYW